MIDFTEGMTVLLIWGIGAHLVGDWLLQNEWVALHKMLRRTPTSSIFDRHPSCYFHGAIHGALQLLVFPPAVALAIGVLHMLIDTREPVIGWAKLIHQTTPDETPCPANYLSIGQAVTIAADQVWHIVVIAGAAFLVG